MSIVSDYNLDKKLTYLTLFLTPVYLIKINLLGLPTNLLEILIIINLILFLISNFEFRISNLKINKYSLLSITLILTGLFLSTLVNENYRTGLGIIKGWFVLPLIFAWITANTLKNYQDIHNLLKTLYFSGFTVTIIAIFYFLENNLTFDGRLQAFYLSPNHLAMFLTPVFLIGIYLIKNIFINLQKQGSSILKNTHCIVETRHCLVSTTRRIFNHKTTLFTYSFSLSFIIFVIYLTYSYATWLALILSLFIVETQNFASLRKQIKKSVIKTDKRIIKSKIILIIATFIIILSIIILTQLNNPKFQDLISLDERSSLSSRIMIYKASSKILLDNFWLGIGPGNFQNKYLEYQKYFPPYLEWAVPQPHNLFLAFWLQAGLLGFLGFVWLVYNWIETIFKNYSHNPQFYSLILSIVLYLLLHGLTDTPLWKNDLGLIFWAFWALQLKK